MKASIIIPIKNGGELFRKVLSAVLRQQLDANYEIIVIDSGSTDGSVDFVKGVDDPRLRFIEIPPQEFGHGKTRNLGASVARGEFLAFLTQDALPKNDLWLANLLKAFAHDGQVVGVFGRHVPYEESDIFEQELIYNHFRQFGESNSVFHIDDRQRYDQQERYRHFLCFYSDNSSAMKKAIWHKIPYPEVDFAEDQIWARTILEMGYKKAYAADSIVYHSHSYPLKDQFRRYYDEYKGLYKTHRYNPVKTILFLPIFILGHTKNDVVFLLKNRKKIKRHRLPYWLGYSLLRNTNRYLGAYFGVMGHRFKFMDRLMSREFRLKG